MESTTLKILTHKLLMNETFNNYNFLSNFILHLNELFNYRKVLHQKQIWAELASKLIASKKHTFLISIICFEMGMY